MCWELSSVHRDSCFILQRWHRSDQNGYESRLLEVDKKEVSQGRHFNPMCLPQIGSDLFSQKEDSRVSGSHFALVLPNEKLFDKLDQNMILNVFRVPFCKLSQIYFQLRNRR